MREPMSSGCAERTDPTSVRIAAIAARQEGIVKDAQLRALGLRRHAIARWVRAGRLHRRYAGVYAVGHEAISPTGELIAALFCAGEGAALSHPSGTHWWGLIPTPPPEIHISVPTRRRPIDGIAWHHPRNLERVLHHRLPVTPVARTLLDFSSTASVNEVRKVLAEADFQNLLELDALRSVMGRGLPGSATLRAAVETHMPQLAETLSKLEDEFLLLCEREGIPLPEPNQWVGPYRVDALWREQRVIVELDGRQAHGSEAQRRRDHERDAALRARGFEVRRYSWYQVFFKPPTVVADLRRTLHLAA